MSGPRPESEESMSKPRASIVVAYALALAAMLPWLAAAQTAQSVDPEVAFERIKGLAGTWSTASGKPGGGAKVDFRVTAGGRAVIETQYAGTDKEMVSVYHLDEDRLVLTHYCVTGNQPRLRLDTAASTADDYRFVFEGGTNLGSAYAPHLHQGAIRFQADGKLDAEWLFFVDGKPAKEPVRLALERGG